MTKKDYIAMADCLRVVQVDLAEGQLFTPGMVFDRVVDTVALFFGMDNPAFDYARWKAYLNGERGPNGGKR